MHHIHNTKAFVLSSFPFGESGKVLNLLTEEFGVIRVNAPGTRKVESKLRQSIQDFSLTRVALVYGNHGWRLTNAAIITNYSHSLDKSQISIVQKIFALVLKMIPDEDREVNVFDIISDFLEKIGDIDLEILEIMTVLRVLHVLGYVGDEVIEYIEGEESAFVEYVGENMKRLVGVINAGIEESHL